MPIPVRNSLAASRTVSVPAAPGRNENDPEPRRNVATFENTTYEPRIPFPSTADSFDSSKRIAVILSSTAPAGPE